MLEIQRTTALFKGNIDSQILRDETNITESIRDALDPLTAICEKYDGQLESTKKVYDFVDGAQVTESNLYSIVSPERGLVLVKNEVNLEKKVRTTRVQYAGNPFPELIADFKEIYGKEPVMDPPEHVKEI